MLFKLVIVGTIATLASAFKHPVNSFIVKDIRLKTAQWEAHDPETNPLRNLSEETIKGMLGTIVDATVDQDYDFAAPEILTDVPDNWDWRAQQPSCVHAIRD